MSDGKIDAMLQQQAPINKSHNVLSTTPYYIQELDRKMDRIEYKIDMLIKGLEANGNPTKKD